MDDAKGMWSGLLKFDLSALPADVAVQSAQLSLYPSSVCEAITHRPPETSARLIAAPWAEDDALGARPAAPGDPFARATPQAGAWLTLDARPAVARWRDGRNFGIAVDSYLWPETCAVFDSREGDHPPRLEINVGPAATATPVFDGPDLTGFAWMGCYSSAIQVKVENRGIAPAGGFNVRAPGGRPAWRVSSLAVGATLELEPKVGDAARGIVLDADNEVYESNEDNNHLFVAVPGCSGVLLPWVRSGR
jgi:hypothetical protein